MHTLTITLTDGTVACSRQSPDAGRLARLGRIIRSAYATTASRWPELPTVARVSLHEMTPTEAQL